MLRELFSLCFGGCVVLAMAISPLSAQEGAPGVPIRPLNPQNPPPVEEETPSDPFEVPEGDAEELMGYIQNLAQLRPDPSQMQNMAQMMDFQIKKLQSLNEAATKLLSLKPEEEVVGQAVQIKVDVLGMLSQMGNEDAQKELKGLPEKLKELGYPEQIQKVEMAVLQQKLGQFDGDKEAFAPLKKQAMEMMRAKVPTLDIATYQLAQSLTMATEMLGRRLGDYQMVAETYQQVADIFKGMTEPPQAKIFAESFEASARRYGLVGKPMPFTVVTLDGKKVTNEMFEGKVILVDFWATWCAPCIQELPILKETYRKYKEKGFEIVSISVDEELDALTAFLENQPLPWVVASDVKTVEADLPSPAEQYGISSIPAMILVGKDGKVIAPQIRGEEVEEKLAELLGPVEEAAAESAEPAEAN
jgi:thiol-disulfide isomerase/thioredoxin